MTTLRRPTDAAVGDVIVVLGTKYRIRSIDEGTAGLAVSGPSWKRTPIVATLRVEQLRWDAIPAVWRVASGLLAGAERTP